MQFRRASKSKAKLRLAIFGPSGAGKTYSALSIAEGMAGRIALVDSERGSASKYGDRFVFDTLDLDSDKSISAYVAAMEAAKHSGYEIIILDSLSHAWQELLADVDKLARSKFKGNSFTAWSEGTPKQRQLVDAILSYPGHVIATMRSKTEYVLEQGKNGKSMPVRVGLSPEQGKGIEFEFDMLMELSVEHVAHVTKDRTGKYQDAVIEKPGAELGRDLVAWLSDAPDPAPKEESRTEPKTPKESDGYVLALNAIAQASSVNALQLLATTLAKFPPGEKEQLRLAYAQRVAALREPPRTVEAAEQAMSEKTDDDRPWAKYEIPAAQS
jgi:hypothetical protein